MVTKKEQLTLQLGEFFMDQYPISWTDPSGIIMGVNSKFIEFYGYEESEAVGQSHEIIDSGIHDQDFWCKFKESYAEKGVCETICTNACKNGDLKHVDLTIKKLDDLIIYVHYDVTDLVEAKEKAQRKSVYLEHASKIMRHDMHAGINTYIPRGVSSLERRLTPEQIKELKIESPLKMIKEGLAHAQKVYSGVYEFTNLVRDAVKISRSECDLTDTMKKYLESTAYTQQVHIEDLGIGYVNPPLFCTAIDNLIRNGLKYNDSLSKKVSVRRDGNDILVEDNGRGMSHDDFIELSKPYYRKAGQKESGTGLGLDIFLAIIKEHGFKVECDLIPTGGTQIKITMC